jgi:hypothetical protein
VSCRSCGQFRRPINAAHPANENEPIGITRYFTTY